MPKLQAAIIESWIAAQRQFAHNRKLAVAEDLIGENVKLEMSKAFVKELDIVAVGCNPKPCHWLGQDYVPQPWEWLK